MRRLVIALLTLLVLVSCGKKEQQKKATTETSTAQAQKDTKAPEPESQPAIPEEGLSALERAINGQVRPYFNAAGTDTTAEVAPGDYFDVYIFGQYDEAFGMNAAEWKVVMPSDVSIMNTVQNDSTILTLGKAEEDFMIAFHCLTGPSNWLVKYSCKAHEGFKGGTIETVAGQNLNFIGFTMCDAAHSLVRAVGGSAEIKKK